MLHIVTSKQGFAKSRPYIGTDDAVVFIDDGVYVAESVSGCDVYAFGAHANARGISLPASIPHCDMAKVVKLVIEHSGSSTWT